MIKKILSGACIACLFVSGFFLPDLTAAVSDWRIETDPVYTIFCPEEEFSYIGTAEDRLRALTGYENMSADYKKTRETDWEKTAALPEGTEKLIPDLGQAEIRARSFTLSHKTVPVNFTYRETEMHAEKGQVRIVRDEETGKILRLSVTGAREALTEWEKNQTYAAEGFLSVTGIDAYALLRQFAYINGFSDISDLTNGNSYGGSVSTVKADVKGAPYTLSVTFSAEAGTMFYRLIQAEGK